MVCPQAAHYRIAEQPDFAGAAWQSMTGTPTTARHTLTPEPGDKRLYVQFRAADGSLAAVALPRAVTYTPTGWAVQFELFRSSMRSTAPWSRSDRSPPGR